jgi:uroporphyrinogen decarboxylase
MGLLDVRVKPDWEEFVATIGRKCTPRRVHHIELFHDSEISRAIADRFGVGANLDRNDPRYNERFHIEFMRFMGYDYVTIGVGGEYLQDIHVKVIDDASTQLNRAQGRFWVDEHTGPIASWEDFEKYPWPDPHRHDTAGLEWFSENLPDDMTIIGGFPAQHHAEWLFQLFGYERLCYAVYEQPDLVTAVRDKIMEYFEEKTKALLQFPRVSVVWGSDDMGFRGGLMIGPDPTREMILPGHKKAAQMVHDAQRLYILHCCGNLSAIMEDLIEDVRIDAKHSFEDNIEDICETKRAYGDRLSLLGGIDMDFLCRRNEADIRKRVRATADVCMPGGGWCLGTGNTAANYIPLDNYLAMVDEGRRYGS